jgi:hypothetical protein
MFNRIVKRVLKHLEARRKWNRMKRLMRDRAEGRLIISLYGNGMIRRRV